MSGMPGLAGTTCAAGAADIVTASPRVEAAICVDGAAVTSVSSASEIASPAPRLSSIFFAACSNHDGISASPPPNRPCAAAVRTNSVDGARDDDDEDDEDDEEDEDDSAGALGETSELSA